MVGSPAFPQRTLRAYEGRTPRLDGRIDPEEWCDAEYFRSGTSWVSVFDPVTTPSDLSLRGWVKRDSRALYFAFEVIDPCIPTPTSLQRCICEFIHTHTHVHMHWGACR
jgi:hypothetical protein